MYQILIVDDEYETCNGLSNYFPWGEIGFEVAGSAKNGKQALAFLESHLVDVILSDIRMPVMDGIEMARILYEEGGGPLIIFLSAHRDFEYARKGLQYGVTDYILKPTKYDEIRATFSRIYDELELVAQKRQESLQEEEAYVSLTGIVKKYIEDNPGIANLEDAARLVNMNAQYLSRLFKQKSNMNFSDYLMDVKMAHAKKLLGNPCYRIGEISEMLGYSTGKNFTRAFLTYFKMSPKKYRDQLEDKGGHDEA